jgi:hypothetical protein
MKIEAGPTDSLSDVTARPRRVFAEGQGSQRGALQEATP